MLSFVTAFRAHSRQLFKGAAADWGSARADVAQSHTRARSALSEVDCVSVNKVSGETFRRRTSAALAYKGPRKEAVPVRQVLCWVERLGSRG